MQGRIGLMPGSRRKEVEALLPEFGKAAPHLAATGPGRDLPLPARAEHARRSAPGALGRPTCPSPLTRRRTATRPCGAADACWRPRARRRWKRHWRASPLSSATGSRRFPRWSGRLPIKVKWVSTHQPDAMQKELFPELLQERATGEMMASQLAAWLDIPPQIEAVRAELAELATVAESPAAPATPPKNCLRLSKKTDLQKEKYYAGVKDSRC